MFYWPVIDTSFTIGVGPAVHFIAEEEMQGHLEGNHIDVQYVFQPDESFTHETPNWNPYLGNDYVAKIQKQFAGRVRGLATIQAWHLKYECDCGEENCPYGIDLSRNIALEELDRAIMELGLWGIRINPGQHNYPINSRGVSWPVLGRLSQLQKITGRRMVVSVYYYGDHVFQTPERLMETAKQFPDLIFLMQHAGFVWNGFTLTETAATMENVYLDLSTMPQQSIVSGAYEIFGAKKFCIGTDGPYGDYRLKEAIMDDVCKTDEEKKMVLGGNLAKVLGLTKKGEEK